jgi:hypothetical protein
MSPYSHPKEALRCGPASISGDVCGGDTVPPIPRRTEQGINVRVAPPIVPLVCGVDCPKRRCIRGPGITQNATDAVVIVAVMLTTTLLIRRSSRFAGTTAAFWLDCDNGIMATRRHALLPFKLIPPPL